MGKCLKNKKIEISAPKQNKKFELPDGPNSISDIQDYFEYIIKMYDPLLNRSTKSVTDNLPIRIYINKIDFRIIFKVKAGYCLEVL